MTASNESSGASQQATRPAADGYVRQERFSRSPPATHRSFWLGLAVLAIVAVTGIGGQVLVLRGIDQYSEARLTLEATRAEISRLEAALPDLLARTQAASVDLAAAEARLVEQRRLEDLSRRSATRAREEADAADLARRQAESAATAAREEAQALQATIAERSRVVIGLVSEIEQREATVSDLAATGQRLQAQLDRLDGQRTARETELGRQESALADLDRASTALRDQQQAQDQQLQATRETLATARRALEEAQSQAANANDLARRRTILEAEVATLVDRRDRLAADVAKIEQRERLAVRTLAEAEATTERLLTDRRDFQADLERLNEAVAAAGGRRDALAEEVIQTTEQVGRLRAEKNQLQTELSDQRASKEAEWIAFEQARRERDSAVRDKATLTDEIARLESRRDILRREVAEQEERVARAGEVARDTTVATLSKLIAEGEALIGRILRARQEQTTPPPSEPEATPGGEP